MLRRCGRARHRWTSSPNPRFSWPVAGQPPTAPDLIKAVDPYSETPLGDIPCASVEQARAAVRGARRTFTDSRWSTLSPADRSRLLRRVVDVLASHGDELTEVVTVETGSPIALSRALQVDPMLEHFAWFAAAVVRGPRGGYEQGLPFGGVGSGLSASSIVREPVGVVAALTPYNPPLMTAAWKLGGALAAGCTAVLLPSPRSALTSMALAPMPVV